MLIYITPQIIQRADDIVNASNSMSDSGLNAAHMLQKMALLCPIPTSKHPDNYGIEGNPATTIEGGSDLHFELPATLHKPRHPSNHFTPTSQDFNSCLESAINTKDPLKQVNTFESSNHHHQDEIGVSSEPSHIDSQNTWQYNMASNKEPKQLAINHSNSLEPFNNNLYDSEGHFIPPPHNFFNINNTAPIISFNENGHAQIQDMTENYNQNHNNYDIEPSIDFRSRSQEFIYNRNNSDSFFPTPNIYFQQKDKPYIHNHQNTFNFNYSTKNNNSQDNNQIVPYHNSDYNMRKTNYGNTSYSKNYNNYWNKPNNICRPNIPRYPFHNNRPFNQNNNHHFYNRFHHHNPYNYNIRNNMHMQGSFKSINNEQSFPISDNYSTRTFNSNTKHNIPNANKFPYKNESLPILRNINVPYNVDENSKYLGIGVAPFSNNNSNNIRHTCSPQNNHSTQQNTNINHSSQKKTINNNSTQKKNIFNNLSQKKQVFNMTPQKKSTVNTQGQKKPYFNTPPMKKNPLNISSPKIKTISPPLNIMNNSPTQKNTSFNQETHVPCKNTFNNQKALYNKSPTKIINDFESTPQKSNNRKNSSKSITPNSYLRNKTYGGKHYSVKRNSNSPKKNMTTNKTPTKQVISKSPLHNNNSPLNDFNRKQNNQSKSNYKFKKDTFSRQRYKNNRMYNSNQQNEMFDDTKSKPYPTLNENSRLGDNDFNEINSSSYNKYRSNNSPNDKHQSYNSHSYVDDCSPFNNNNCNDNQNNNNNNQSNSIRETNMKPLYDSSKRNSRRPDRPLFIPQAVRMLQRANVLVGDSNIRARSSTSRESIVKDKLDGFGVKIAKKTPISKKMRREKSNQRKSILENTEFDNCNQVEENWDYEKNLLNSFNKSHSTSLSLEDDDTLECWPSRPTSELGNTLQSDISPCIYADMIQKTSSHSLTPITIEQQCDELGSSLQTLHITTTNEYSPPIKNISDKKPIKQVCRNLNVSKLHKEDSLYESINREQSKINLNNEITNENTPTPNIIESTSEILQESISIDLTESAGTSLKSSDSITSNPRQKKRKQAQPYKATGRNFKKNDQIEQEYWIDKNCENSSKNKKNKKKKNYNLIITQKNEIEIDMENKLEDNSIDYMNDQKTIENNLTVTDSNSKDPNGGLTDDDINDDRHQSFIKLNC